MTSIKDINKKDKKRGQQEEQNNRTNNTYKKHATNRPNKYKQRADEAN